MEVLEKVISFKIWEQYQSINNLNLLLCEIFNMWSLTWCVRGSISSLSFIIHPGCWCTHSAIGNTIYDAVMSRVQIMATLVSLITWSTIGVDAKNANNKNTEHKENHASCTNVNPSPSCAYDIFWVIKITLHKYCKRWRFYTELYSSRLPSLMVYIFT